MKHSFASLLLIIISMLLLSCGSTKNSSEITEDSTQAPTESSIPETDNGTTSIPSSSSVIFTENEDDTSVTLYKSDDFCINFIINNNYFSGETEYYYEYISQTSFETSPSISIENIKINDFSPIYNYFNFSTTSIPDETRVCSPITSGIEKELADNNISCITNISGTIIATSPDWSSRDSFDFNVEVPSSIYDKYYIAPYMDALATTQTLHSDESIDIKLIALGNFSRSTKTGNLRGIISCTNKTDHALPFNVQSAIVNGWCFNISKLGTVTSISPGMTSYHDISISDYNFSSLNISSIASLDLLIMTDDSENTSINNTSKKGGMVYPVTLSKSGILTESKPEGRILYQSDNFVVYDSGYNTSSQDFTQYFIIENNSPDIISYGCENAKYNGENCTLLQGYLYSLDGSYLDLNPNYESIPPGTKYRGIAWASLKNPTDSFTFSFNINFYSAGGGKLIEASDRIETKN